MTNWFNSRYLLNFKPDIHVRVQAHFTYTTCYSQRLFSPLNFHKGTVLETYLEVIMYKCPQNEQHYNECGYQS